MLTLLIIILFLFLKIKNMTLGLTLHNPGNIKHSNFIYVGEKVPSKSPVFKEFYQNVYGYRALFSLLTHYIMCDNTNTIEKIITKYAPSNEKNTQAYIKDICEKTKIFYDAEVSCKNQVTMQKLVTAICEHEQGDRNIKPEEVQKGMKLFYND